jgi:hypothetical protein
MKKQEFMWKIGLTAEWEKTSDLYPDNIFEDHLRCFEEEYKSAESEIGAPEHYRHGIYQYWLKRGRLDELLRIRGLLDLESDYHLKRYICSEYDKAIASANNNR